MSKVFVCDHCGKSFHEEAAILYMECLNDILSKNEEKRPHICNSCYFNYSIEDIEERMREEEDMKDYVEGCW